MRSWSSVPGIAIYASDASNDPFGHLCPDLLRYEQIGAADTLRGRVVRTFFFLLRSWPTR